MGQDAVGRLRERGRPEQLSPANRDLGAGLLRMRL